MIARLNTRLIKIVLGIFCTCVALSLLFNDQRGYDSTRKLIQASRARLENTVFYRINNETLGFQHIYAIGLKERTDKRDYLTLSASVTGMQVEWLDGVQGDQISEKALPEGLDNPSIPKAALGCWRAHMNALLHVVQNRYTTALILEDDSDWDVSVRLQLREFARGVRVLTQNEKASRKTPYGTNWDLLWIGGCATLQGKNESSAYVVANDPTVTPTDRRGPWEGPVGPQDSWRQTYPEFPIESSRYIYRADEGCCTFGYAVTYEGARKILAALAIERSVEVDTSLSELCGGRGGREQIRCYGVYPNIIGTFKSSGHRSKDSDIQIFSDDNYHGAEAWNVVYSTRMNLKLLLAGAETVYSQWKDSIIPWSPSEVNLQNLEYPRGYLVG